MKLKNVLPYIAKPVRICLTVLIVLIAVSFLQTIVLETCRMFTYVKRQPPMRTETKLTENEERIERIRRSSKEFLPDGTIHLVNELRPQNLRSGESRIEQIYDANDHLLWEGPSDRRPYEYLSWAEGLNSYDEVFDLRRFKDTQMLTPAFSRNIEIPVGSINNTEQIWRYLPGAEYFIGYNTDGEKIGYISASGFSTSRSKTKPFGEFRCFTAWSPRDSSSPMLLWQTQKRIYHINFEKQDVELIFESTDSDIETINIHAWRDLKLRTNNDMDDQAYRPLLVCTTKDGTSHLILREPDRQLTFTVPEAWQGWIRSHYLFTATRQGIFVWRQWGEWRKGPNYIQNREKYDQWWREYIREEKTYWVELYRLNENGGLEMLNHYKWIVPPPEVNMHIESTIASSRRFIMNFSPPLYNVIIRAFGRKFWLLVIQTGNRGDFFYTMLRVPLELQPLSTIMNLLVSVLMMGFVFWHGLPRRTSLARFIFWLVFVGVLNLTGLLTYLALNHTAVITCPICKGRRGLAQTNCVRCKAPLPTPKRRELDLIFNGKKP